MFQNITIDIEDLNNSRDVNEDRAEGNVSDSSYV